MGVAAFLGQALLGWLIADLLGGFVHWLEDRVIDERTPFLQGVIAANRLHHRDPMAFTRSSAWSRSAGVLLLTLIIAAAWLAVFGPSVMLIFATIGGAVSNEVHCAAHSRRGPVVGALQEIGVLASPRLHGRHHRAPFDGRYCPLTDWLNSVLDGLDVWRRLERLLDPFISPGKAQ